MAEQFLDGADIVAGHQEVGREAVAKSVAADLLWYSCGTGRGIDGLADDRLVEVVAAFDARTRIDTA